MNRFLLTTLGCLAASTALSPTAAVALGQQSRHPAADSLRLREATVRLTVTSAHIARVEADYELAGDGAIELLLTWFPDQTLSELELEVNGTRLQPRRASSPLSGLQRWLLPPVDERSSRLRIRYRVQVPRGFQYRYPVAVPDAPAEAGRPVEILVHLPPGATFSGDSFPNLTVEPNGSGGSLLRAQLLAVPSFVQVVFGEPAAGWLSFDLRLELAAAGLALLPLAWLALRRWRRRTTSPPTPR